MAFFSHTSRVYVLEKTRLLSNSAKMAEALTEKVKTNKERVIKKGE